MGCILVVRNVDENDRSVQRLSNSQVDGIDGSNRQVEYDSGLYER